MSLWFTSDLHFGHRNIIGFCDRPFNTVHEMNEAIIAQWNSQVEPNDVVHVLGDVCMGHLDDSVPLLARLNGFKMLTPGNHDPVWPGTTGARREKWGAVYRDVFEIQATTWEANLFTPDPTHSGATARVMFCHFPYLGHDHRDFDDFRPVDHGGWLVHGHTHGLYRQSGRQIDVGIDAWGGELVSLDTLIGLMHDGPNDLPRIPWRR